MIPTPAVERFKPKHTQLLVYKFCTVERLAGTPVVIGNYGVLDLFNQLTIGATNVGTIVRFPSQVKNYLYIDIEIIGGIAGIYAQGPGVYFGYAAGLSGVTSGTYICRLPYCGPLEFLQFQLTNYVVKSITAYYPSVYSQETRNLTKFNLTATSGSLALSSNGTYFSTTVAAGASISLKQDPALLGLGVGFAGRLSLLIAASSGLPLLTPGYSIYDGVSNFSNYTFAPTTLFLEADNTALRINYINLSPIPVIFKWSPTVITYSPLSTVYGASDSI